MIKKIINFSLILAIGFVLTGCPKKPVPPPPVPVIEEPEKVDEEPTLRGKEYQSIPELKVIYFDYDKSDVSSEASIKIKENAEYMKQHLDLEILVEGHCCECGTNEYNLALGQKRALTIRDYYIKLGIDGGRVATISYGEEKPVYQNAGPPDSPSCAYNRRAETKVRAIQKPEKAPLKEEK